MHRLLVGLLMFFVAGCGTPSFLITPVSSSSKLEEVELSSGRGWGAGKIAIIPIEGVLANTKEGGFLSAVENPLSLYAQQLNAAAADDSVKAVVLRINSPGGTVASAEAMYEMLRRFKHNTGKPVVAATSEVCASGAYFIACASDRIVAQPTAIVGSIGVIFNTFDASGTMAKIGLKSEAVKSGPNKDMGSPFKPLEKTERDIMQGMVDEYFDRFKNVVRDCRTIKDEATFALVTDGRIFSGQRATELGLVDQVGLLEDAIALARQLSNAPKAGVVTYKRPYAYSGSIYAAAPTPMPQANTFKLQLPGQGAILPSGFYYLWNP